MPSVHTSSQFYIPSGQFPVSNCNFNGHVALHDGIDEKRGMTTAKMTKVKEGGERKHGEHKVQERGHTRAMEPKMKGNTIGDGPLYNVKGPAMKRGGKTHHKK